MPPELREVADDLAHAHNRARSALLKAHKIGFDAGKREGLREARDIVKKYGAGTPWLDSCSGKWIRSRSAGESSRDGYGRPIGLRSSCGP